MDLVPEVAPYVLVTLIFDLSTTGRDIGCVMLCFRILHLETGAMSLWKVLGIFLPADLSKI